MVLDGGDGDDVLRGGDERTILRGGSGRDRLFGDLTPVGSDRLRGGSGADSLRDDGRDRLLGGTGIDENFGGQGSDLCRGPAPVPAPLLRLLTPCADGRLREFTATFPFRFGDAACARRQAERNTPRRSRCRAVLFVRLALGIAPDFGARPDQRREVSLGDVADVCARMISSRWSETVNLLAEDVLRPDEVPETWSCSSAPGRQVTTSSCCRGSLPVRRIRTHSHRHDRGIADADVVQSRSRCRVTVLGQGRARAVDDRGHG